MSTYYVPGSVTNAGRAAENMTGKSQLLWNLLFHAGKQTNTGDKYIKYELCHSVISMREKNKAVLPDGNDREKDYDGRYNDKKVTLEQQSDGGEDRCIPGDPKEHTETLPQEACLMHERSLRRPVWLKRSE